MNKEFYQQIQDLLKQGHLHQAQELAEKAHKEAPDDLFNNKSLALVYLSKLEKTNEIQNISEIITLSEQILSLQLP
ncbi:hypothetical protein [Thermaurantimonas aggregans]|nr:hypothetical protein [Thermaurantimonas aggregans]MCX8148869.1 hypothetical protein [Thermaurantimonas aggregans]